MNAPSTDSKHRLKWTLCTVFLLTVPVPYYMLVVGGMVPTFYIFYISVKGLIVALPKFTAEGFWMVGIMWTHVVILGGFLYLAAHVITWLLFRLLPYSYAFSVVVGLIVALVIASTFEIYQMPGHNSAPPANIFRIFKSLIT